jgi:hypothetical protein
MDEVMNAAQQLPPEIQQQVQPLLQQLQSLPPEQREQQLGMILQQMMPQGTPAGMEAQAGMEEDLLMAAQQQQPQQPSSMMPQEQAQSEDAASAEASAVEAKNELDNVRVNLSVRELLDLIGKGSATASLLKVKQLADQHNQKMEAIKQKAENEKQQKVEEEQSAQSPENMMGAGGIYSQPMTAVN